MESKSYTKTKGHIHDVKYQVQLYWFAIISFFLLAMTGLSTYKRATRFDVHVFQKMDTKYFNTNSSATTASTGLTARAALRDA